MIDPALDPSDFPRDRGTTEVEMKLTINEAILATDLVNAATTFEAVRNAQDPEVKKAAMSMLSETIRHIAIGLAKFGPRVMGLAVKMMRQTTAAVDRRKQGPTAPGGNNN